MWNPCRISSSNTVKWLKLKNPFKEITASIEIRGAVLKSFICFRNGGGAFFIPYVAMAMLLALPLTFLDLSVGQFCSLDCIKCRNFFPIFKGKDKVNLIEL